MDYRQQLLKLADDYSAGTGRSLARVATLVRNDGKFFKRLKLGAGCTMDTYERSLKWFSEHWPEGADWPVGIERPINEFHTPNGGPRAEGQTPAKEVA